MGGNIFVAGLPVCADNKPLILIHCMLITLNIPFVICCKSSKKSGRWHSFCTKLIKNKKDESAFYNLDDDCFQFSTSERTESHG